MDKFCLRCQQYGHRASQCKSPIFIHLVKGPV
jgi:hypothetical protein